MQESWGGATAFLFLVRTQLKKDMFPERKALFDAFLETQSIYVRFLYNLIGRSQFIGVRAILCLTYGAITSPKNLALSAQTIALEYNKNETEFFNHFSKTFDRLDIQRLNLNISQWQKMVNIPHQMLLFIQNPRKALKLLRFLMNLNKSYPLYACLRIAQGAFLLELLKSTLAQANTKTVIVSTDGNPHGLAAIAAAKTLQVEIVFLAHSPWVTNPAAIQCDIGIFWGDKSKDAFLAQGAQFQKIYYVGRNKIFNQMNNKKDSVCISLSKDIVNLYLKELIRRLKEIRPEINIIVRPHPNSFRTRKELNKEFSKLSNVSLSQSTLDEDLSRSYLNLAGNSTVHLESLVRGVKSIYISQMDATAQSPILPISEGLVETINAIDHLSSKHLRGGDTLGPLNDYFHHEDTIQLFEQDYESRLLLQREM